MKKYFAAFSATALISIAPHALAASSTDLTVRGTITPSACTPSFPGGGDVDFGQIPAKDLNPTSWTRLPSNVKKLNVACDAPTAFALHTVDNRPNTTAHWYFGMGLTPAGEKLGYYMLWIQNVVADGDSVRAIVSENQGVSWRHKNYASPKDYLSVSSAADTVPLVAENVSMDVEIRSWIARTDGLTLTDDITIDGSMTFEMKYL
ncbi:DUF1120 domain-containing protein [Pseudomonas sp. PGPR40]|uniref:DUF1120 domain-containing protein n=1 Tax=Pseudomonas sp. PGPR40 TaxID=2913476 RepID=UPI001EDC622B|nr:DUF1120 domain-containing protein [Pseudomonas sp. PGPR40]